MIRDALLTSCLGKPGVHEGISDSHLASGAQPRPVVPGVVGVGPAYHRAKAALPGDAPYLRVEGALAVVAAIDGVPGEIGVVKLVGLELHELDADRSGEPPGLLALPGGKARGDPDGGKDVLVAEGLRRQRQEERAVNSPGKRDDHPSKGGHYLADVPDLFPELVTEGLVPSAFLRTPCLIFHGTPPRFSRPPGRSSDIHRSAPRHDGRPSRSTISPTSRTSPSPGANHLRGRDRVFGSPARDGPPQGNYPGCP